MSLDAFRSDHLIVLSPEDTAFDAARAMADNHVGAVLIAAKHRLVGIVTDRDLALAIVGLGRDAHRTRLDEVMTREVATLDLESASIEDALRTMRERSCRRLPLTSGDKLAGMVSLDELLADGRVDAAAAGEVVRGQLAAPTRLKPEGTTHPVARTRPGEAHARAHQRHEARADLAHARLVRAVERYTGLDRDRSERALVVVLGLVCSRMTGDQAKHFIAQLPSRLQPELEAHAHGPDKRISVAYIVDRLRQTMQVGEDEADRIARGVGTAIGDSISTGEIEAVRSQLPSEMKALFPTYPMASGERGW